MGAVIPNDAIAAAKEAMREVTPPPGVSKADWLAEYGDFALIAGAIAAAAIYMQAEAFNYGWREGAGIPSPVNLETGELMHDQAMQPTWNPYE